MPMYQPSVARRVRGLNLDGGGHVVDLDTAVKDGILGGGGGSLPLTEKKLDLKTMIQELESIEIPAVFICPISLETMHDPVTLCTGQTYERCNILKWFSLGHYTCPTTMQELWEDSVTPNTTLRQLIWSWFGQNYAAMRKRSEDVQGRVLEVLESLKKVKGQARVNALKELRRLVNVHSSARSTVVENAGVGLIGSLLGPFTSHAVGSEVIGILLCLEIGCELKRILMQPAKISLMVDLLNEGSVETKINCARLIDGLMEGEDLDSEITSSLSLVVGLLRLIRDKRHSKGVLPGLSLLKTICMHASVRSSVVSVGTVPQLVELLPRLNHECLELVLYILEVLSTVEEGREALRFCAKTIPSMVRILMKVSETCTQLTLSILWAVFKLASEECASVAVEAGLAAKLLLVIQSGCNSTLKQRAAELLKLCSLNYTTTSFISKCKLTRTIQ